MARGDHSGRANTHTPASSSSRHVAVAVAVAAEAAGAPGVPVAAGAASSGVKVGRLCCCQLQSAECGPIPAALYKDRL